MASVYTTISIKFTMAISPLDCMGCTLCVKACPVTTKALKDGTPEKHTYMDYRITCDERIADGHAYSVALRYFNSLIRKPELLDTPPETIVEDIP